MLALGFVAECRPHGSAEAPEPGHTPAEEPRTTAAAAVVPAALAAPAPPKATEPEATETEATPDPSCPAGYTCDRSALDRAPRPRVTEIFIQKREHKLHLVSGSRIVRSYGVAIGSGGYGFKRFEGDRVTPVGTYTITGRYPSRWHTYLALSYPSDEDRARFAELASRGEVDKKLGPGSAIAIHGRRADMRDKEHKQWDWTLGCIALDNDEIDAVATAAAVGTRVVIKD
jgi:lipoprotein-anchoring transpeptidase ErfK/SrfK